MDEPSLPQPGAFSLRLDAAGEAWSWRLTAADGSSIAGLAPDRATARRSAAFAAYAAAALDRGRRRRP